MAVNTQTHWEQLYKTKASNQLSWFQQSPSISLGLIRKTGAKPDTSIMDIGGGESRLADALSEEGFHDLTVLDLSGHALAAAKARLGAAAAKAEWIVADVTAWEPERTYDLWHDRAAFHFLTGAAGREAYAECVSRAVRPGGHVIIGTFSPDGPDRFSGLPVQRHDAASISAMLGEAFALVESLCDDHVTPAGKAQRFQFSVFRRGGSEAFE
ncbi:MAG: class I SAM-dependent methyltransferase [Beijerinckiaceae bacterium]|nr:class I SAM-dependent methyltransferase [Beijerinckiaceae bacterium]MCI0598092.1 class I SAM-dependent methyltransferase [Beijerinckiaceae bacterium]MCI0735787.1 class I SAM-dependent methyltransferase [Beijerinckiaceae bacterium]